MSGFWKSKSKDAQRSIIAIASVAIIGMLLVIFPNSAYFMASIIGGGEPAPFDGTTSPLKETLNWVKLSSTDYTNFKSGTLTYSEAATAGKNIPIPKYDTDILKNDPKKLGWAGEDLIKRNVLLTYVTAYMGDYTSGSSPALENTGSHLALDIRAAKGTPVFAIANGKVSEMKLDNANGNLVVLTIPNAPSFDDPNTKTTYYASYLHMDTVIVQKGQVVTKGEQIGTVGSTGLATTYHLHFQIDKDTAPWHPYWPFTWAEAAAKGFDFFTGVNEALGQEKAIANTINPLVWIYKNEMTVTLANTTTTTPPTIPVIENPVVALELTTSNESLVDGQTADILISALNKEGNIVADYNKDITISSDIEMSGSLSSKTASLVKGSAKVSFTAKDREVVNLTATDGTNKGSVKITVTDKIGEVAKFGVEYTTEAMIGDQIPVTITSLDANGLLTPGGMADAIIVHVDGVEADVSKSMLSFTDFISGKASITVTPKAEGSLTVSVVSGNLSGNGSTMMVKDAKTVKFIDIPDSHPHAKAINYLKEKAIIGGYSDGTFKPDNTVNRAEALKIILGGAGIENKTGVDQNPFPDVITSDWFAGWVLSAKERSIVNGNPDGTFTPQNIVNGAEALKMILLTNKIDLSAISVFADPFSDVLKEDWFAVYYQYAKDKVLVEAVTDNKIFPSKGLTRGDLAEIIYRLMKMVEKGAEKYDVTL